MLRWYWNKQKCIIWTGKKYVLKYCYVFNFYYSCHCQIEPKLALAKSESMVPTISENKENPNKVFIGGIPPLGKEFIDPALYQAAIDELKEEVKSALEQLAYPESVSVMSSRPLVVCTVLVCVGDRQRRGD